MVGMILIGIASPDMAGAIAAAGGRLDDTETCTVEAAGLAALMVRSEDSAWRFLRPTRTALKSLLHAQRMLEAAARFGPVLPARPGSEIRDEAEARRLLGGQRQRLAEALQRHGSSRQFQITISWDPAAALAARRDRAELAAAAAVGARGAGGEAAQMIQRFMSDEKTAFEVRARRAFGAVAEDVITLPVDGPDMLINAAVLLKPGAEADLERTLEALDSGMPGDNRIRLIGPLPPVSFAAIAIERPSRDQIAAARRVLGLRTATEPRHLRRAYLDTARAHHPDSGAGAAGAHQVGAAAEAFRLLDRVAEARRCMPEGDVLLVDIVRQDEHRSLPR